MGFWAGFASELRNIDDRRAAFERDEADRAFRREQFIQKIKEDQRNVLIPHLLNYVKQRDDLVKEQKEKIRTLKGRGLSIASASALVSSGQADSVIRAIRNGTKVDEKFITQLDNLLVNTMKNRMGEEDWNAYSAAMTEVFNRPAGTENEKALTATMAISTIMNAKDPFESAASLMSQVGDSPYKMEMGSFPIKLSAANYVTTSEANRVQRRVADAMVALTGDSVYTPNADGSINVNTELGSNLLPLIKQYTDKIITAAGDPSDGRSILDIEGDVLDPLFRHAASLKGNKIGFEEVYKKFALPETASAPVPEPKVIKDGEVKEEPVVTEPVVPTCPTGYTYDPVRKLCVNSRGQSIAPVTPEGAAPDINNIETGLPMPTTLQPSDYLED